MIDGSPALQERERRALDRISSALSAELGGSFEAQVVAGAIAALHAAQIRLSRSLAATGTPGGLAALAQAGAESAFTLLENGIGNF